jgi:hypothetical protein
MVKSLRFIVFVMCLVGLAGSFAMGQADEIQLNRAIIQAQRQAIVAANLGLTEEEGQRFWPLFRDYRNDLAKSGDRLVKLITTYADNYENLSDDTATWMVTEYHSIAKEQIETREGWLPRFREVISPVKLARFVQIENKLDAIVNYELADTVPLVQ